MVLFGLFQVVWWTEPASLFGALEWLAPNMVWRVPTNRPVVALSFDDGPSPAQFHLPGCPTLAEGEALGVHSAKPEGGHSGQTFGDGRVSGKSDRYDEHDGMHEVATQCRQRIVYPLSDSPSRQAKADRAQP